MNGTGGTFAGYRLDQLLATDTVSSIYRATPMRSRSRHPRPVALRVTNPLRSGDGPDVDALATYIRRISAAVKITHRALEPIVDAGETDDRVFVATALIDGVTLGQYIRDHGGIAPTDAVPLLRDLAEGLDRARAAGIVHGAIGPRTVLIRRVDGRPRTAVLRGFGIDTLLARQVRLNRDRIDLRDVQYVTPEQLLGDVVDGRADQYSLACALYHCVTGAAPFVRETASATFGAHLFSAIALAPLAADPALRGALAAGLSKRPGQRHASCADLLSATGQLPGRRQVPRLAGPRTDRRVRGSARRPAVTWPDDGQVPPADPPTASTSARRRTSTSSERGQASPASTRAAPPLDHEWDVRPRSRRRRAGGKPHRQWIGRRARTPLVTWPIATMMVLAGIVTTLALISVVRQDGLASQGRAVDGGLGRADGALAAADEAPAAAGVRWQRALTDEPLYALHVLDDTVVAAAQHMVMTLDAERGASVWRRPIDVGVLTDIAVTRGTVALRAATFRALSLEAGARLWDKADIVAPVSSLSALDGVIYGVGPGRLTPELVAVEAATGEPVWYYDGGSRTIGDGAAVVAGGAIVALLDAEGVVVVERASATSRADDGRVVIDGERWQADVVDPWPDSLAVLPDAVFVASRTGQLCAFDPADGAQRWCVTVDGLTEQAPAIIADGDTVVVVLESTVTALALESGARRWTFDAPRALHPIAASTGRQLVVSDVRGRAFGLDLASGFEAWRASGFGEITALAGTDDAVYAGTRDGVVVRLQPPTVDVPS